MGNLENKGTLKALRCKREIQKEQAFPVEYVAPVLAWGARAKSSKASAAASGPAAGQRPRAETKAARRGGGRGPAPASSRRARLQSRGTLMAPGPPGLREKAARWARAAKVKASGARRSERRMRR